MIDIVGVAAGPTGDLQILDTQVERAANVLGTQIGSLEYAQTFGIDLRYFLTSEISFQNESFKGYIIERLAAYTINVAKVIETISDLFSTYDIKVTPADDSTGLLER